MVSSVVSLSLHKPQTVESINFSVKVIYALNEYVHFIFNRNIDSD